MLGIITGLGDILLNFLCLLSTINYKPVSTDINVAPVCIDYDD